TLGLLVKVSSVSTNSEGTTISVDEGWRLAPRVPTYLGPTAPATPNNPRSSKVLSSQAPERTAFACTGTLVECLLILAFGPDVAVIAFIFLVVSIIVFVISAIPALGTT